MAIQNGGPLSGSGAAFDDGLTGPAAEAALAPRAKPAARRGRRVSATTPQLAGRADPIFDTVDGGWPVDLPGPAAVVAATSAEVGPAPVTAKSLLQDLSIAFAIFLGGIAAFCGIIAVIGKAWSSGSQLMVWLEHALR